MIQNVIYTTSLLGPPPSTLPEISFCAYKLYATRKFPDNTSGRSHYAIDMIHKQTALYLSRAHRTNHVDGITDTSG
jgi:hypothetical protein